MAIQQFLPARVRVALNSARNDARALASALQAPRFKGARVRQVRDPLEVRFVPPRQTAERPPQTDAPGVTAVVVFADSGVTVELGPDETILEAGLRNGVDLLFSCTLGGCGACMLHVTEGEVGYDDPEAICLTDDEVQDGCCLACVGKPRRRVVLEA